MRNFIIIFVFIFLSVEAVAQAPNWQWAKSYGKTSSENVSGIINDNIGNSVVCGFYFSSSFAIGTTTLTNKGNYDSFVAKFNNTGNPQWAISFGGIYDDNALGIDMDASGNVYVVGSFISPALVCGTTTLTNSGFGDLFVVKIDANGNFLWAKNYGDGGSNQATSVSVDISGNAIVVGSFNSASLTINTTTLTGSGNDDAFVMKINPSGTPQWAQSFGDNLAEIANGVATDNSGNIFISGFFKSAQLATGSSTLINNSPATADLFLIKLNNAGTVINSNSAGDFLDEIGTGVTVDNSGNVILTGYYFSPTLTVGTSTLSNNGNRDVLAVKFNNNCNVIWARGGGGSNDDYGYGIAADAVGNIYINGHNHSFFSTYGTQTLTINGVGDGFLVAYNASGSVLWIDGVGGANDEGWNTVSLDGAGNIYCGGYFASPSISLGTTNLISNGNADMMIAKMLNTTGIKTNELNHDLVVFPNPSNGIFTIRLAAKEEFKCEIYNEQGELLLIQSNQQDLQQIDLSNHPKGIYLVRVLTQTTVSTKKIIIN